MNTTLFDRRIDVYIYDQTTLIGSVITPSIGLKPEITVKGNMVSNSFAVNSEVTITNLERSIPVEQAKFLYVEMYYGEANVATYRTGILFNVLYADQSKQPPDRQVKFMCTVASVSPNILQRKAKKPSTYILGSLDSKGVPIQSSLHNALKDFIRIYNRVVQSDIKNSELKSKMLLNREPIYRMPETLKEKYANKLIATYFVSATLDWILDDLCRSIVDKEQFSEDNAVFKPYYALNIYIERNSLVVAMNPSYTHYIKDTKSNVKEDVELNYVVSAYRCGELIYCTALFDPRITPNILIKIDRNAVIGRRASGDLLPISETVYFRPINRLQYAFSTTKENYMQMQGVCLKA